jgi:CubicO group peptidase (beta-lactamase class C family)
LEASIAIDKIMGAVTPLRRAEPRARREIPLKLTSRMHPTPPALERLLDALVESGTVSAAVALAGGPRRIEWCRAVGWARGQPPSGQPAEAATWFDFGSLTKPFVATLALGLDRSRELLLATRVGEVFAGAHPALAARPLADLLRHRAGLVGWTPLYARCRSLAEVETLLLSGALLGARAGTYSDLDYLLWGLAAERALGRPLGVLVTERVLAPLDLAATTAVIPGDRPQVAESRMGTAREVELAARLGFAVAPLPPPPIGLPQDGNARFLASLTAPGAETARGAQTAGTAPGAGTASYAGTAAPPAGALLGHAGLFGPASALWRLGAEWLAPCRLLQNDAVAAALAPPGGRPAGRFALGWWRRRHRGAGGPALSPLSYGHTGFAGGSLWIDPLQGRVFVLLAHRIAPASDMNRWRRRFHATATNPGPAARSTAPGPELGGPAGR